MKQAILLAAGRGRRLQRDEPKCLIEIAGKALLERHVENLSAAGIESLAIVVGFKQERIREFLTAKQFALPIELIENSQFERGSIVSLQVAGALLENGAIWMDADVLYPAALMSKLVASKNESCVLLDRRSDETGEEMMLGFREGRIRMIARRVAPHAPWDLVGEAVGFAKVGPRGGAVMRKILDAEVAAGRLDQEYEAAMNIAFGEIVWGYEPVDEFAWTEIDFQEDVEKAERIAGGDVKF